MMTKVVYVTFFDQLTDKDIIMPFLAKTTKVIGFSSRVIIKYKYSSHKEAYVYEIKEEENLSYPYIDEIVDDFPLLEDKKEDIEKTADYYFCSVYKILERLLPFPKKEEEYRKVFYVPCSPTPLNKINKREYELLELIRREKKIPKDDFSKSATINSLLEKKYIKEIYDDEKAPSFSSFYASDNDNEKLVQEILDSEEKNILVETDNNLKEFRFAIDIAKETLKRNKSILIISPNISLANPFIEFLNMNFKDNLVILSSNKGKERIADLKRINNESNIVIYGDKYAVFAPIKDLGLILVFQEENYLYKDEKLFLNYKDIALKLSYKTVLFSKCPKLMTKAKQLKGYLKGYSFKAQNLVQYKLIQKEDDVIPAELLYRISECLKNKEQVLIFHNSRGTSPFYKCDKCSKFAICPSCGNTLTYYEDDNRLSCLSCGYHIEASEYYCSSCGGKEFSKSGIGTMGIQKYLEEKFKNAKISRLDADSYKDKDYHMDLSAFATGDNDIIVGTKELKENYLLPKVKLIIVMDIDWIFKSSSYNIEENYYEILNALLNSARLDTSAYIITSDPTFLPLNIIAQQDYQKFYEYTLNKRRMIMAPPYYYLIALRLFARDKNFLLNVSDKVYSFFEGKFKGRKVFLIGPYNVKFFKKQRGYKSLIMIKYRKREDIEDVIKAFLNMRLPKGIGLEIDVDPEGE